jgi:hypothetical protein
MRPLLVLSVLLSVAGCGKKLTCKHGTILLHVTLEGAAVGADSLAVTVDVDGTPLHGTAMLGAGVTSGTLEIDFADTYPAGKSASITVDARHGAATLASGSLPSMALPSGCASLDLDIGGAGDMGVGDGSNDSSVGDFAPNIDASAPVRLVAGSFTAFGTLAAPDGQIFAVQTNDAKQTLLVYDYSGAKLATLDDGATPAATDPAGALGVLDNAVVAYETNPRFDGGAGPGFTLKGFTPLTGAITISQSAHNCLGNDALASADGRGIVYCDNAGDDGMGNPLIDVTLQILGGNLGSTQLASQQPLNSMNAQFIVGKNILYYSLPTSFDITSAITLTRVDTDNLLKSVVCANCSSFIGVNDNSGDWMVAGNPSGRLAVFPTSSTQNDVVNVAPTKVDSRSAGIFGQPLSAFFVPGMSKVEIFRLETVTPNITVDIDELDYSTGIESGRVNGGGAINANWAVTSAWVSYSTASDPLVGGGDLQLQPVGSTTPMPMKFGALGSLVGVQPSGVFAFNETPSNSYSTWSIDFGSATGAKIGSTPAGTYGGTFIDDQTFLYFSFVADKDHDLMLIDLSTMTSRKIASHVSAYQWSPLARRLFWVATDGVYLLTL